MICNAKEKTRFVFQECPYWVCEVPPLYCTAKDACIYISRVQNFILDKGLKEVVNLNIFFGVRYIIESLQMKVAMMQTSMSSNGGRTVLVVEEGVAWRGTESGAAVHLKVAVMSPLHDS